MDIVSCRHLHQLQICYKSLRALFTQQDFLKLMYKCEGCLEETAHSGKTAFAHIFFKVGCAVFVNVCVQNRIYLSVHFHWFDYNIICLPDGFTEHSRKNASGVESGSIANGDHHLALLEPDSDGSRRRVVARAWVPDDL